MTLQHALFLLLLPLVLATIPQHAFIRCPCTFTLTRPLTDNTPFTVTLHPINGHHPTVNRPNLTNLHAEIAADTAAFRLHVPLHTPHAPVITPSNTSFTIQHVSHTVCPTLLKPDPPGIFRQLEQRVVGGTSASRDLRAYLAYLYNPFSRRACTGTIISPRWILSAAHCRVSPQHIAYLQGAVSTQGKQHLIKRVIPHFSFDSDNNAPFDISVIELATPSDGTPMQVSVNIGVPFETSAARVLGYGSVSFDSPTEGILLGELRQVDVPINTNVECMAAYGAVNQRLQVCAGYLGKGGCDSCQGDSGGPLIQYTKDEQPVLVGVVSRGRRCGEARYPGIYVRVGAFEEWLDSVVTEPYLKAQTTRAILAVTNSSKASFQKVLVPIAAICLSVLVVGFVIVLLIRYRRWRRRHAGEKDEETGSTEGTDGVKAWRALNVGSNVNDPAYRQRAWSTGVRRMDDVAAEGVTTGNEHRANGDRLNGRGMVEDSDSDASFISEHNDRVDFPQDRNDVI